MGLEGASLKISHTFIGSKKNKSTKKVPFILSQHFETAGSLLNRRAFYKRTFYKYPFANPNKITAKPSILSCPHLVAEI